MTDIRTAWAMERSDAHFISKEECTMRARKFDRTIRRRNAIEYVAGGVTLFGFGLAAWFSWSVGEWLLGAGWIAGIIGILTVLLNLHRRASAGRWAPEQDVRSHLRAQLERQYQALWSVHRWYIAPLVPGMALVTFAVWWKAAGEIGLAAATLGIVPSVLLIAGVIAAIIWLNRRAAGRLRREIAELDAVA